MLIYSNYNLLNELKRLFNLVSDSVYYPENWNHEMICTTYKSGPKNDPSNHHGITLTSCLGKLFSTLFRKNYRKIDHIMTLFTLIKKSLR